MNDKRSTDPARGFPHDAIEGGPFRSLARGGEAVQHLRQALERVERESVSLVRVAASCGHFVHACACRQTTLSSSRLVSAEGTWPR